MLAAAAGAARREGLPLPIPITLRYPSAPATDESDWQELVVGALALPEWQRLEIGEELDLLGPVSTAVLRRHGVLWPPNSYVAAPLLAEARGGSLLTGIDGDWLFGGWGWARPMAALCGRVRPRPRDALRVAHGLAPAALRQRLLRHRAPLRLPWLRPDAQAAIDRAWASQRVGEPRRFGVWVAWWRRLRYLSATCDGLRLLAGDAGARIVHPLLDGRFLAAVARRGGIAGFGARTAAMRGLFGGLLPDELLARRDKPAFDTAFWGRPTRAFTASWEGEGVDRRLVDERRLREVWGAGSPDFRTATLVQLAWLASAAPSRRPPAPRAAPDRGSPSPRSGDPPIPISGNRQGVVLQ